MSDKLRKVVERLRRRSQRIQSSYNITQDREDCAIMKSQMEVLDGIAEDIEGVLDAD